jgi:hypothetical protein
VVEKVAISRDIEKQIRNMARTVGFEDTPLSSSGTHNIELRLKKGIVDEYVYIARFTGITKNELQIVVRPNLDDSYASEFISIPNVHSAQKDLGNGKPVQGTQYPGFKKNLASGNYRGRAWRLPINGSLDELKKFLWVIADKEENEPISEIVRNNSNESENSVEVVQKHYSDFGETPNDNPSELNIFARKVRKGQSGFREKLIKLYSGKCSITGSTPVSVLEAAHIYDHSESGINHSENGLLLRADIHLLFDDGLLRINPDTLLIELSDTLKGTLYWELNGIKLRTRADGSSPSKEYLMKKWYSQA